MKLEKRTLRLAAPVAVSVALLIAAVAVFFIVGHEQKTVSSSTVARVVAPKQGAPAVVVPVMPEKVLLRPLPVSLRKGTHEWTGGDGSDPLVIEKLAHSAGEFIRMAEENERIKRRQLVYRQETAAAVVQRSRATGEPVRNLTLPGLDGREILVEVTSSDLALSGLSGTFTGQVKGKLQSIVTLAFKNNREAFSVSSPEDGLFLEAEPREPGEIIIKEIDPMIYVPGKCGNPEHNH